MHVSLTPELERFVREKVESGEYTGSSEVVREALRLLRRHEMDYAQRLAALRAEIREGLESGNPRPGEEVFAELRARKRAGTAGRG